MADKQITELPANSGVTNETLFPAYQPGAVAPAQKVSGAQVRAFAEDAAKKAAGSIARGGTFTPQFNDATGYLSWTNDMGLPNPDPVQLEGVSSVNGKTGAVKLAAADVGALARDGSNTMTGELTLSKNGPTVTLVDVGGLRKLEIRKNSASVGTDFDYGSYIRDWSNDGRYAYLKMFAASQKLLGGFLSSAGGTAKEYELLHTGNKPSGSYTGNGSATQRTIEIPCVGNATALLISRPGVSAHAWLVTPGGAFKLVGTEITGINWEILRFVNGVLYIGNGTTMEANTSGNTYSYQVL